tara:strand:+ start:525 stop:788 length:264 start_codon:yes stop_codon:yes gene_type:complete
MKDEDKEEVKIFTSAIAIILFTLLIFSVMSCSNVETSLDIPQHIRERILETENTYIVDVRYLVWNDITESYEWEHYSDYNYTLMSKR